MSVGASAKAAVLNSKIFFVKLNKTVANVVEHVALVISGVFKYKNQVCVSEAIYFSIQVGPPYTLGVYGSGPYFSLETPYFPVV